MLKKATLVAVLVGLLGWPAAAQAVNIETVHVGNAGNTGELSGQATQPRVCGAVDYAYNIGKYEVTAGQYTEFLNAIAKTDTYGLYNSAMANPDGFYGCQIQRTGSSGSWTYSVPSLWANRPVNNVSWGDAARFANWLHNRQPMGGQDLSTTEDGSYYLNGATHYVDLMAVNRKAKATWVMPSEDEWYKAAYHKNDGATANYFDYPTSTDTTPSNDRITPDPGNNVTYEDDSFGYTIGSPYWRTVVATHENSDSPYGTFDQGGNVWEWTEANFSGAFRGIRGGSYGDSQRALLAGFRNDYTTAPWSHAIGFRVTEVPEPATLTLLALGGLALLRRGR